MPRRTKVGKVVSDKNAKTIVVEVYRRKQHPVYRKYIQVRKRFMAHDENETAQIGDMVRIIESRPFSASKHWALDAVLTRGVGPEVQVRHEEDLAIALGHEEEKAEIHMAEEAEGETVEEIVETAEPIADAAPVEETAPAEGAPEAP
jgi:small subunit ribosomal protein S17